MKRLKNYLNTISWCFSLSWTTSKLHTILKIGIQTLLPFLVIGISFIGKYLMNLLTGDWIVENPERVLLFLFLGLLVTALIKVGLQKLDVYNQVEHIDLLQGRISLLMMDRSLMSDLEFFDNPDFYDKLLSATRDSSAIINMIWNVLTGISAVISFGGVFFVLGQSHLHYCLLMMAAAIPSSIVSAKYTKSIYELSLDQINSQRKLNYYKGVAVDRRHAQDLRLFNAGNWLKKRYEILWNQLFVQRQRTMRKRTVLTTLLDCLPEIVIVYISITIAYDVFSKTATLGDYSLITGLVGQLWVSIGQISSSVIHIYDNQLKIENIRRLDEFQNHVLDIGIRRLSFIDSIRFEHVSFSYHESGRNVLEDVTFDIRSNEKVALVGLNGSGKTTIIKLLLRMYDPDSGTILINETDIREYSLSSLRCAFSVYFQEMQNFSLTLKENLLISDIQKIFNETQADKALKASSCEDILEKASQNLNTSLTRSFDKDGIELSNGQLQKLALARALYRSHKALILDEPSSNLDPKAEHEIFEALREFSEGKLTIFTSHRLSNVSLADRIVVLEKGRVVEDGTQEELLKNKQRYAELYNYQKKKFDLNNRE